jgi:hypothetical protein
MAMLQDSDLLKYKLDGRKPILCFVTCFLTQFSTLAPLSATDGKVGALLLSKQYFVTSLNEDFIPEPPLNSRQVFMRADSLYGDDDPLCWPQPYNPFFCHHAAIPLRNSLPAHSIMWWEPTRDQFAQLDDPTAPIQGLGKLSEAKLQELKHSASVLFPRMQAYISNQPVARTPPILGPMVKMIEHGLARLESVHTNFRQMAVGVRDVQRCWLDVTAMLDYMQIYKPRMDSAQLAVNSFTEKAANTIGVFTNEVRVAQDFYHAGLPCWLIRPVSDFGKTNVLKVVPLLPPDNYVILTPHHRFKYPVIFEGSASSFEKYNAILGAARNFLRYPDPFNISSTDDSTSKLLPQAGPSAASHTLASGLGTTLIPGPSRRPDNRGRDEVGKSKRNGPYKAWGSVVGRCYFVYSEMFTHIITTEPMINSSSRSSGRNKFILLQGSIMPLAIPVWRDALEAVDRDPSRVHPTNGSSKHDGQYLFPDASLFATANESRCARFFATWKVIRSACIFRVFSADSLATPVSNQQWRDFLFDGLVSACRAEKVVRRREEVKALFANALEELPLNFDPPMENNVPHFPNISHYDAQKTLWELTELNFRFELLALDKRASSAHRNEDDRQAMILKCFAAPSLLAVDSKDGNAGLQSVQWSARLPFLIALKALLQDWDGLKPTPLLLPDLPSYDIYTENDVRRLEDSIAHFYTQSFFSYFGRAATVPMRLPL